MSQTLPPKPLLGNRGRSNRTSDYSLPVSTSEDRSARGHRRTGSSLIAATPLVYRSLGRDRRYVWTLAVIALIGGTLDSVGLYIIARLATSLTAGSEEVQISVRPFHHTTITVTQALLLSAALVVIVTLLGARTAWLSARVSEKALTSTRRRLIDAYLHSSWSSRSRHSEGYLQHLVADFTPRYERLMLQLTVILVNAAGLIMAIALAVMSAPTASLYFIAGLGLVAAAFLPLTRRMPQLSRKYLERNREVSRATSEAARMGQEIDAFNVASAVESELDEKNVKSGAVLRRFRFLMILIPASYQNAALAVVIGVIALIRTGGPTQLAAMGAVLMLLVRALIYARQIQNAAQASHELAPYALGLERDIDEMRNNAAPERTRSIGQLGTICFQDVNFAYPGAQPVFEDLNLEIPFGEMLGIAGPSGVGKSTLLQLLLRLREPSHGKIMVNGIDLQSISSASWAATVGFVPQDNQLIRGTAEDNIRFYRQADRTQIEIAARQAHLWDEIEEWADGLSEEIGPGARDLSGGQKQRLGIARALLNKPQLLILDEPTSALDAGSESSITATLKELRGKTTVVVVAHRPETLAACDRIVELSTATIAKVNAQPVT